MSDIEKIIDIIITVRKKIKDDTDVVWAGYDSLTELQVEIDSNLKELQNGNLDKLDTFKNHFLPTATFQEVSLSRMKILQKKQQKLLSIMSIA